jgi:hypothetical protein
MFVTLPTDMAQSSFAVPRDNSWNIRAATWLFVVLSCAYALLSSGRVRTADEYMQFFQAQSLVEHGSTAIPQAVHFGNFYGTRDRHGLPRAPYPPGQALMSVPLLDFARFVLLHFPGVSQQPQTNFYMQVFGAVLTTAFCAGGVMTLFFLTLCKLDVSLQNAVLITICVSFGTPIFPYSGYFFSEPFTAFFLMAVVYLLSSQTPLRARRTLLIGMLLALLIWIRPTMVFAAGIVAVAILVRDRRAGFRPALIASAASVLSGAAYLASNKIIFGRGLQFGYPDIAEKGKQLNTFHTPFYIGLKGFLISPGKSVFIFFPLILLAIFGVPQLWRRNRALGLICAALPIVYLLFYMRYTQWEGGFCPGPRYLVPFLCLTCLALGPLIASGNLRFRRLLVVLSVFGFIVQAITYSTSFLEDQIFASYYDSNFNYRMSYNPLVSQSGRLIAYLKGKPASLGFGFDRWFVFLHKAGVGAGTELLFALPPLFLMIWGIFKLMQALRGGRLQVHPAWEPEQGSLG